MVQRPSSTPVFLLAGGTGERLSPLTASKPKPAVSFGGTHQIIDFTISNCVNSGLRRIYALTQYQREHLHDYIRETRKRVSGLFRWQDGDELTPVPPVSGKRYRGTADAVFQNLPLIRWDSADNVLIAAGDHIYSMDYRSLLQRHAMSGADMTIAAVRRPVLEAGDYGVLDVEGLAVTRFREKPSREMLPETGDVLVSMGVYVFKRQALLEIADRATPMQTDFGLDIVPQLVRAQKVSAYDFSGSPGSYWRDVGNLDSYFQANMDLLGPTPGFAPEMDTHWPIYGVSDPSLMKVSCSRISRRAVIGHSRVRHSVISHGAYIDQGAIVENSVILPGAHVGKNVLLRNAIVAESASIPDGFEVGVDLNEDRKRFIVTPQGVVVVDAAQRQRYERPIHSRGTGRTVYAA